MKEMTNTMIGRGAGLHTAEIENENLAHGKKGRRQTATECKHIHRMHIPVHRSSRPAMHIVDFCQDCRQFMVFDISEESGGFLCAFTLTDEQVEIVRQA